MLWSAASHSCVCVVCVCKGEPKQTWRMMHRCICSFDICKVHVLCMYVIINAILFPVIISPILFLTLTWVTWQRRHKEAEYPLITSDQCMSRVYTRKYSMAQFAHTKTSHKKTLHFISIHFPHNPVIIHISSMLFLINHITFLDLKLCREQGEAFTDLPHSSRI